MFIKQTFLTYSFPKTQFYALGLRFPLYFPNSSIRLLWTREHHLKPFWAAKYTQFGWLSKVGCNNWKKMCFFLFLFALVHSQFLFNKKKFFDEILGIFIRNKKIYKKMGCSGPIQPVHVCHTQTLNATFLKNI